MHWSQLTLIALAVHTLGLWMAVDAVMKGRTAQGAVAWSLALVLLPWASVPLYLVFGDRRFYGYVRARRLGTSGVDRVARELAAQLRPFVPADADPAASSRALTRLARLPFTTGNQVDLLIDGEATFDAILRAIDEAQSYVLVQFYIFRADGLGMRLQRALLAARARGVRVYLLYDEIGSHSLPREYLQALRAAQCECSGFRTKRRKQRPFRINFRNHRKIVIADGRKAFLGGHNVGDEYLGLDPELSPWRDTHVAIRGPAVQCVQLVFVEDWFWAKQCVPDLEWAPRAVDGAGATVLIVPSSAADEFDTCALLFSHVCNAARTRLWLASPYFVPGEQLVGALQFAALRGVDVRVIIPEMVDSVPPKLSSFAFYGEVLPAGVKMYRYQRGFPHQKVILSDDLACVGTVNLDNRSFRINFEITAVVADPIFAAKVAAMLEADVGRSRLVAKDDFDKRPFWFRLACRVSRLLAPIQ